MRVYLAGPYAARDKLRTYAHELGALQIHCVSSWLEETHGISEGTVGAAVDLDDAAVSEHAQTDLEDIGECDVLVLFTEGYVNAWIGLTGSPSGGRHVETGYALAKGKYVVIVGEPENVFHRMANGSVEVVADWYAARLALQQWQIRELHDRLREVCE